MRFGLAGAVALVAYLALSPSPIDPVAWRPSASPGFEGPFARNDALELLMLPEGHGPESVAAGPDGWLYTGVKGGRILRFRPDGSGMEIFSDSGGRANGMDFDAAGNLIVADSYRGLLSIDPTGKVYVLATEADGQRFVFNDGVAVAADGTIWFTDATARFPDGWFHYDVLEGAPTGRLLRYDLASERLALVDWLQPHPLMKRLIAKAIGWCFPDTDSRWIGSGAFVVAIDLDGHVVHNLQDAERRYVTSTGALEHEGFLYLGSVAMDAVGRVRLPGHGQFD